MTSYQETPERFRQPITGDASHERQSEIYRFNPERIWSIATQMVDFSLGVKEHDRLLIQHAPGGRQLAEMIGFYAARNGATPMARPYDNSVTAAILAGTALHPEPARYEAMLLPTKAAIEWSTHVVIIDSTDMPDAFAIVNGDIDAKYSRAFAPIKKIRL